MTKRYCDKCGQELSVFDHEGCKMYEWFTLTRHGLSDYTFELCEKCFCECAEAHIAHIRQTERSE